MKWTFTAISRIILGIHPIIMTCRAQHNFLGSEWPVDDSKGTPTDTHTHTHTHQGIGKSDARWWEDGDGHANVARVPRCAAVGWQKASGAGRSRKVDNKNCRR